MNEISRKIQKAIQDAANHNEHSYIHIPVSIDEYIIIEIRKQKIMDIIFSEKLLTEPQEN
jgi:hypothetical protein